MHFSSVRPTLSCESRYLKSFWKRSWILSKFFLIHLYLASWAMKCSFCASVLPFLAPRGRSFLMTWFGIERERPIAIGEDVGWMHFLSKDVHKCNKLFLDSNKEGILSIALLVLFRITRITLHCPFHGSSLSNCCWMGCRHYRTFFCCKSAWSASRWGWLSIFLTSSWTRKFSASFTTACNNPGTLKSMSISSSWVDYCPPTGLTVLVWSASTFSSASSSLSTSSTDTGTQLWLDGSPSTGLTVLSERTLWLLTHGSPRAS